jgi:hypothetical protein
MKYHGYNRKRIEEPWTPEHLARWGPYKTRVPESQAGWGILDDTPSELGTPERLVC